MSSYHITYRWGESGGVRLELDVEWNQIDWIYIEGAGSTSDITLDLEGGSADWGQRRRWYAWLATCQEEPTEIEGDGFEVFREVYTDMVPQWIEEARAAQAGAA